MNDRGPLDLALRAMRDCGPIIARREHPGFAQASRQGLAETFAKRIGSGWVCIFRLTPAGEARCRQLKPWSETA